MQPHDSNPTHAYLSVALPAIEPLLTKVVTVHGEHNPRLYAVSEAFAELGRISGAPLAAARLVGRLREQTDGYATPAWGCRSYRLLMTGLEELENGLVRHMTPAEPPLMPKPTSRR